MHSPKLLLLYSFLFGLCVPLALAPFDAWPLMFIGIAGFFWLNFMAKSAKQAMFLGWFYGAGYFCLGVSWIYGSMQTVDTPVWLSVILTGGFCILMALFHAFQMWFFHRFLRLLPFALLLIAPSWWVVNEWIREWFLTGMPWLYAGYAFSYSPVAQLAAVAGIYGLSFLAAIFSATGLNIVSAIHKNDLKTAANVAMIVVIGAASATLFGLVKPASSWKTPIRSVNVAAVQSNVDQRTKWHTVQQKPTLAFYGNSIESMTDVDLILWPEAAMTRLPDQIPYFLSQIQDIGEQRDQAIITGTLVHENERFYNAMMGFGTASGHYKKQHLVPFGEYVPLESILRGLIAFFDLPMSTMFPAPEPQSPLVFELESKPYFAAPVICYEAAYPELVRRLAKDSNILTIVSNDAWFGDSIGPHQHLQITQMRAIENGLDLVRATQNGVSALITADGDIVQKSEQFVEAELVGTLMLRSGNTPFQTIPAAIVAWLSLIFIFAIWLKSLLKHRSR